MYKILIRPLVTEDAEVSFQWRNDAEVWKFTGSKPDKEITPEIEKEWLQKVLLDKTSRRFAITADEQYIGNIQLTNIKEGTAEYHIFIGARNWWGKGIARQATYQILIHAKEILKLKSVYLSVRNDNLAAIRTYTGVGFKSIFVDADWTKMQIDLTELALPPNCFEG